MERVEGEDTQVTGVNALPACSHLFTSSLKVALTVTEGVGCGWEGIKRWERGRKEGVTSWITGSSTIVIEERKKHNRCILCKPGVRE